MPEEGQPYNPAGTGEPSAGPGPHRSEWAPEPAGAPDPEATTRPEPAAWPTDYRADHAADHPAEHAAGSATQQVPVPAQSATQQVPVPGQQPYGTGYPAGTQNGQPGGQFGGSAGQSPWWVPDAQRDPWRDPGSAPAWLPPQPPTPPPPPLADLPAAPQSRQVGLGLLAIVALVVALLAGSLGGALGYVAASRGASGVNVFSGGSGTPPLANRPPGTIAAIAQKVQPAVVSIEIRGQNESGNGSGFVISQDGYIITNNHVAEPAANGGSLKAVFADGMTLDATIVGRDPNSDIAVIKVAKTGLVTLPFGDSDKVAVGDPVIAFGSPLDLQGTVTSGIVSAIDRPVVTGGDQNGNNSSGAEPVYTAALQTDASINPGNSGGPLVDGNGRVVGVDSSIAQIPGSGGKGSIGIGFAIPINLAKRVASQIVKTAGPGRPGTAKRTVMGATLDNVDLPNGGVRLKTVQAGGPAQKAGLRDGDVVTKFNGKFVADQVELIALTRKLSAGTSVPVEYVRGGATVKVTIVLTETS